MQKYLKERIEIYVQHHLKNFSNLHSSYLQDSPDFIRSIEVLNGENIITEGDILCTIDVSSLYTNICAKDGLAAVQRALVKHSDYSEAKIKLILDLLEVVLVNNIFEFNGELFKQVIGTAMGAKPAPDLANLFMAEIDAEIVRLAENNPKMKLKYFKRFLDDLYFVVNCTTKELHSFLKSINNINPSIQFTIQHTPPYNID